MQYSLQLIVYLLVCLGCVCPVVTARETLQEFPADSPNYELFSREKPPLLPMPRKVEWMEHSIDLDKVKVILPEKSSFPEQIKLLEAEIEKYLASHNLMKGDHYLIRFELSDDPGLSDAEEAYELVSGEEETMIKAASSKGLYYGWKTLRQLILRREGRTSLALVRIEDKPAFPIRGFMNDVGRNYMDLSLIREVIEVMADYKMNVYHFHFTDNYGWRLESRKYPQLQDPASFERKPGKYYTQKEFIDFVEFCRLRNIMVIPELDMPGHTASFRKALGCENMDDPAVTGILIDLIRELASLVPVEKMPYIHIGTDEAHGVEVVSRETLRQYFQAVYDCGREPIHWQPGMSPPDDKRPIQQLWSGRRRSKPHEGSRYIDSLENYVNHLDPFEAITTMYFRKSCILYPQATGLGGILCSWPDLYIEEERKQLSGTPVFSSIAAYSESVWSDNRQDDDILHHSNLPLQGDEKLEGFREFENRLLAHRDRFFRDKEFLYVRQSDIPWKLLGPFPNNNKGETSFPPELAIGPEVIIKGKTYTWSKEAYTGATLIFKHYSDYPTHVNPEMGKINNPLSTYYATTFIHSPETQVVPFWISGHFWPGSDFRDGPMGVPGKWFHADPKFWVNGKQIPPPEWTYPNRDKADTKLPLANENYHLRPPTYIELKKGWNQVLVKSPHNSSTRRWMFTFVPVQYDEGKPGCNLREYPGLRFSVALEDGIPVPEG